MATNLGLEASIYDNSAKQNIAWFNCLANKHAVPVSASKNKSLGEKILKSFYESWENYANTKLRIVKISAAREPEVWEMWLFTVNMLSGLRKILRCHHWKFQSLKIFLACTLTSFIVQRKCSLAIFDQPLRHLLSLWLGLKPVEIYFTGMKMWFS